MFLNNIKEEVFNKFIIRKSQNENTGYINKLILRVSRGHTLWETESYNLVVPYGLLLIIDLFLIITVMINFFLHPKEIEWFKSGLDFGIIGGIVLYCCIHIRYAKIEEDLSIAIDKWWTYTYLEQETEAIKKNIQQKLELLTGVFIKILSNSGIAYTLLPVLKYFYNGAKNTEDLMVVDSLHDVPWIYLEMLSGALIVPSCCRHTAYFIANMIAISFTHVAQLQLAGLAFTTIEERVTRMMGDSKYKLSQVQETFEYLVQNEIKSCAKHYQAIYRQINKMYSIKIGLVNYIFYVGCGCSVTIGVVIAKENKLSFLILQVMGMMVSLIVGMFLIVYPLDSIIEEVEAFRLQVYGSSWYNLPQNCQKGVHLMQTTLMNGPICKTFLGSEVTTEFLAKVLNAAYFYITTILSMDIE